MPAARAPLAMAKLGAPVVPVASSATALAVVPVASSAPAGPRLRQKGAARLSEEVEATPCLPASETASKLYCICAECKCHVLNMSDCIKGCVHPIRPVESAQVRGVRRHRPQHGRDSVGGVEIVTVFAGTEGVEP